MKINYAIAIFVYLVVSAFFVPIVAEVGCMGKSKHAFYCNEGSRICCSKDYKQLYYVDCSCPCSRYPQFFKFGQCSVCGHYRKPVEYF